MASPDPNLLISAARLERYRRNFELFAREQLIIAPKMGQLRPLFPLYPTQANAHASVLRQLKKTGRIRQIWFKARQTGGSTLAEAYIAWLCMIRPNMKALTIAQDKETTKHIFEMSKLYWEQLSHDIRPESRINNRQELILENPDRKTRHLARGLGSHLQFQSAGNIHAGTGFTISALHLSEVSKYTNPEEVWASLSSAVPSMPGTAIIIESTAFLRGDFFKTICERAMRGEDEYEFVQMPWFNMPEYTAALEKGEVIRYSLEEREIVKSVKRLANVELTREQMKWRRNKIAELTAARGEAVAVKYFRQEYPYTFEDAWVNFESQVYPVEKLAYQKRENMRPPERWCSVFPGPTILDTQQAEENVLRIWEEPEKGKMYDIGVDVATGVEGGNCSTACVITRSLPHRQVAEWQGHVDPIQYAVILNAIGRYYNIAQIAVEMNNIGYATNVELIKAGYPYIYTWRHRERTSGLSMSTYSGWKTQFDSKKWMIALSTSRLIKDEVIIRSPFLLNELDKYSVDISEAGNEYYAASEGNDDLVDAFNIALVVAYDEANPWDNMPPRSEPEKNGPSGAAAIGPGAVDDFDVRQNGVKDGFTRLQEALKPWRAHD